MKQHLHRSENLLISLLDNGEEIEFEVRFSDSYARGTCDALCPRCGHPVAPQRWEIEGPDSTGNTVWFACTNTVDNSEPCGEDVSWTRRVSFHDWIEEDE